MVTFRRVRGKRGAVLIIVAGILAALTLMGVTFALISRINLRSSRNVADRQLAKGVASSAVGIGIDWLMRDETLCDDYRDVWFTPRYRVNNWPMPGQYGSFHSVVFAEGDVLGVADLGWHINEDPGGDANKDGAPGIRGVDDDGDGWVDEGSPDDDDEDGNVDEDGLGDANDDGRPGIANVDDDTDGRIDEDNSLWADNDGDGAINEDPPGCQYMGEATIADGHMRSEDRHWEVGPIYSEDFPGKSYQRYQVADANWPGTWRTGGYEVDRDGDGLVWEEGGIHAASWGIVEFYDGDNAAGVRRIDENADGRADVGRNIYDADEDRRASVWSEGARLWWPYPEEPAKNYYGRFRSFAGGLYGANAEDDDEDSDLVTATGQLLNVDKAEGQIRDESSKINLNAHGSLNDPALFISCPMVLSDDQLSDKSYQPVANDPRFNPRGWMSTPGEKLTSFDVSLVRFFRSYGFTVRQAQNFAIAICRYRYGADGMPGVRDTYRPGDSLQHSAAGDDDFDNPICEVDGRDNDGDWRGWIENECTQDWGVRFSNRRLGKDDGIPTAYRLITEVEGEFQRSPFNSVPLRFFVPPIAREHWRKDSPEANPYFNGPNDAYATLKITIDEPREGIDEPDEFDPVNPKGDDRPYTSIEEMVDALVERRDVEGRLDPDGISAVSYIMSDSHDNDNDGRVDEDDASEELVEARRVFNIVKQDVSCQVANLDTGMININMDDQTGLVYRRSPRNGGEVFRRNCWRNDGLDNDFDGKVDDEDTDGGEAFPPESYQTIAGRGRYMADRLRDAYARCGVPAGMSGIGDQVWFNIVDFHDQDAVPSHGEGDARAPYPHLYGVEGIHLNEVMPGIKTPLGYVAYGAFDGSVPAISFDKKDSRGNDIPNGGHAIYPILGNPDAAGQYFVAEEFEAGVDGWVHLRSGLFVNMSDQGEDSYTPLDDNREGQPEEVRGRFIVRGVPAGWYVPIIIHNGKPLKVQFVDTLIADTNGRKYANYEIPLDPQTSSNRMGRYAYVIPFVDQMGGTPPTRLPAVFVTEDGTHGAKLVLEVQGGDRAGFALLLVNPYIEFINISRRSIPLFGQDMYLRLMERVGNRPVTRQIRLDGFYSRGDDEPDPADLPARFYNLALQDWYEELRQRAPRGPHTTKCITAAVPDGQFPPNYGRFVIALSEVAYDLSFSQGGHRASDGRWGTNEAENYPAFFLESTLLGGEPFIPLRSTYSIELIQHAPGSARAQLIAGGRVDGWPMCVEEDEDREGVINEMVRYLEDPTKFAPYTSVEKIAPVVPTSMMAPLSSANPTGSGSCSLTFEDIWKPSISVTEARSGHRLASRTSQKHAFKRRYTLARLDSGGNLQEIRSLGRTIGEHVHLEDYIQPEWDFALNEGTIPMVLDGPFPSPGHLGFVHSDRGIWRTLHPIPSELGNVYGDRKDGSQVAKNPIYGLLGVWINDTQRGNLSYPRPGTSPGNWRQLATVPGVRAKININTASHAVLNAAFGSGIAAKIVKYRPYRSAFEIIGLPTPYTRGNPYSPAAGRRATFDANVGVDVARNPTAIEEGTSGVFPPFGRYAFETFTMDQSLSSDPAKEDFDDSGSGLLADDLRDDIGEQFEWYRRFGSIIDIKSRFFTIYGRGRIWHRKAGASNEDDMSVLLGEAYAMAIVERVDESPDPNEQVESIWGRRIESGPDGRPDGVRTIQYQALDNM